MPFPSPLPSPKPPTPFSKVNKIFHASHASVSFLDRLSVGRVGQSTLWHLMVVSVCPSEGICRSRWSVCPMASVSRVSQSVLWHLSVALISLSFGICQSCQSVCLMISVGQSVLLWHLLVSSVSPSYSILLVASVSPSYGICWSRRSVCPLASVGYVGQSCPLASVSCVSQSELWHLSVASVSPSYYGISHWRPFLQFFHCSTYLHIAHDHYTYAYSNTIYMWTTLRGVRSSKLPARVSSPHVSNILYISYYFQEFHLLSYLSSNKLILAGEVVFSIVHSLYNF